MGNSALKGMTESKILFKSQYGQVKYPRYNWKLNIVLQRCPAYISYSPEVRQHACLAQIPGINHIIIIIIIFFSSENKMQLAIPTRIVTHIAIAIFFACRSALM